jgi:hypothetical protein
VELTAERMDDAKLMWGLSEIIIGDAASAFIFSSFSLSLDSEKKEEEEESPVYTLPCSMVVS